MCVSRKKKKQLNHQLLIIIFENLMLSQKKGINSAFCACLVSEDYLELGGRRQRGAK